MKKNYIMNRNKKSILSLQIATEVKVVEKIKKEEGLTKADITREQFLERAWAWTKEYGGTIQKQQRRLGCSCDWDLSRF